METEKPNTLGEGAFKLREITQQKREASSSSACSAFWCAGWIRLVQKIHGTGDWNLWMYVIHRSKRASMRDSFGESWQSQTLPFHDQTLGEIIAAHRELFIWPNSQLSRPQGSGSAPGSQD